MVRDLISTDGGPGAGGGPGDVRGGSSAFAALFKGGGWQGHGQPHLATGEDGLGDLGSSLAGRRGIVRLILDDTVVRVSLDREATTISAPVMGILSSGRKVLLSVRNMGGESEAAWRRVLDDLVARGLKTPQFLIIDGAGGLERALAALWPAGPTQRCTVRKHRNLLGHAPDSLHEELRV